MQGAAEQRTTEQGSAIDARLVRDFSRAALEHDAVAEAVNDRAQPRDLVSP